MASALEIAAKLNLVPNPEGGLYAETFRDTSVFLSESQLPSQYKVDREIVELDEKDGKTKLTRLGPDIVDNQRVQYTVPPDVWFGAFPTKDFHISIVSKAEPRDPESHYSLVGCTCAPAFQFQDFELAKRSELVASFPDYETIISLLTLPD